MHLRRLLEARWPRPACFFDKAQKMRVSGISPLSFWTTSNSAAVPRCMERRSGP
jgi:hypothetical protein